MGLCKFKNVQTGAIVEANFPLHPMLVEFRDELGHVGQMETADFTAGFTQVLPLLPQLIVTEVATDEEMVTDTYHHPDDDPPPVDET